MRRFLANLNNIFPLGSTGYVKDIPPSERIPPKSLGSAVPDPNGPLVKPAPNAFPLQYPGFKAQAGDAGYVKDALSSECKVSVTSTPGIITDEPAPSIMMEAQIDGHTYKGVLYLVSDEQEQGR